MIIKRLTVYNFGVYAGINEFCFTAEKPVVLIGGMNGRGKTTFLEAILLALYGSNSFAYKESKHKSYGQYLRSHINTADWSKTSYVDIEFEMQVGHKKDIYIVHREWDALSKRTKETISVSRNGQDDVFLTENWAMYVEDILPSALSNFFFFDGEKIAELAVDSTGEQMKESIRALLGISVLDTLDGDLSRITNKYLREKDARPDEKELEKLKDNVSFLQSQISSIDEEIAGIESLLADKKSLLQNLNNEYLSKGGDINERRQEIVEKKSLAIARLGHNHEKMMELSSGLLPLVLIKELLQDVKLRSEDEHDAAVMRQSIDRIQELFDLYTKEGHNSDPEFIQFLRKTAEEENKDPVYNLSDHALYQIGELVESSVDDAKKAVTDVFKERDSIKEEMDTLDSYLSAEIDEEVLSKIKVQIDDTQKVIYKLEIDLENIKERRANTNGQLIKATAEYNRFVDKYVKELEVAEKGDRILKYAHLANRLTAEFALRLQKKKTGVLAETITYCYKQLANKKNMIDTVVMDPETLDMMYLAPDDSKVDKASLSAGEKQLMVIAILWALARCSNKKLPVIIDTPLSRLDSAHRESLIKIYFPQASEQTIILSTDSEINHEYYDMMKPFISDEFLLMYDDSKKSTTVSHGYFTGDDS